MRQMEEKVQILTSENELLLKNNKKLKHQLQQLQEKYNNIEIIKKELEQQNMVLKQSNYNNRNTHFDTSIIELSGQLANYQEYQNFTNQKENKKLKQEIEQKNEEIAKLKALIQISSLQNNEIEDEYKKKTNLITELKEQNEILQNQYDKKQHEIRNEAQMRIELEHLRAENQIFTQLLGFTPSLENQGEYEHNLNSVELQLIKKQKHPIKPTNQIYDTCKNCNRNMYLYRSCCNPLHQLNDKLLFVPGDAFNFAQRFKTQYLKTKNDLEIDELMEILLFELNKIWYDREKNNLQLLAKHCKDRIKEYKRKEDTKLDYCQKDTLNSLQRMQKQLKELQQENLELFNIKFSPFQVKL